MGVAYDSYSQARSHLKDLLDAAERGVPATVLREGSVAAVVDAERLRTEFARLCRPADVVAEAGGWSVVIPGVPVAADGASFEEALDEMVDALREYASDWQDHLREAGNHRGNWALVQLIALSSDDQLRDWLSRTRP
ncbi:MAG: type II toxin-antitoxin system HicB family antitoxin [Candidatus Dormibacteria bacterium]